MVVGVPKLLLPPIFFLLFPFPLPSSSGSPLLDTSSSPSTSLASGSAFAFRLPVDALFLPLIGVDDRRPSATLDPVLARPLVAFPPLLAATGGEDGDATASDRRREAVLSPYPASGDRPRGSRRRGVGGGVVRITMFGSACCPSLFSLLFSSTFVASPVQTGFGRSALKGGKTIVGCAGSRGRPPMYQLVRGASGRRAGFSIISAGTGAHSSGLSDLNSFWFWDSAY